MAFRVMKKKIRNPVKDERLRLLYAIGQVVECL